MEKEHREIPKHYIYRKNEKILRRQINTLETWAFIATTLNVGIILAFNIIKTDINGILDFLAFIGIVILMALLGGIPVSGLIYLIIKHKFNFPSDFYLTAWDDGVLDEKYGNESDKWPK